jgi:ribosomal protein S12 methylthiotransferase
LKKVKISRVWSKRINLISQDFSDYGSDFEGFEKSEGKNPEIYNMLKSLENTGAEWIRVFYFYPDDLTEDVMDLMASSEKICKYLDMPIQHFSDKVLRRMNRRVTGDIIHQKIKTLREKIPGIVLRTSVYCRFSWRN